MKARFCDECKHHVAEEAVFTDGRWTTCVLTCTLGHKPRFFKPKHINDSRWGWKRACADFEQREKEAGFSCGRRAYKAVCAASLEEKEQQR